MLEVEDPNILGLVRQIYICVSKKSLFFFFPRSRFSDMFVPVPNYGNARKAMPIPGQAAQYFEVLGTGIKFSNAV